MEIREKIIKMIQEQDFQDTPDFGIILQEFSAEDQIKAKRIIPTIDWAHRKHPEQDIALYVVWLN